MDEAANTGCGRPYRWCGLLRRCENHRYGGHHGGSRQLLATGSHTPPPHERPTPAAVTSVSGASITAMVFHLLEEACDAGAYFLLALFHTTSALGTVGLSARSSTGLETFGKLLLTFIMLLGRLGPKTFLVTPSALYRSRSDGRLPAGEHSRRIKRGCDGATTVRTRRPRPTTNDSAGVRDVQEDR